MKVTFRRTRSPGMVHSDQGGRVPDHRPHPWPEHVSVRPVTVAPTRLPQRVGFGQSAMSAQYPVCPKADMAGRFMSTRP